MFPSMTDHLKLLIKESVNYSKTGMSVRCYMVIDEVGQFFSLLTKYYVIASIFHWEEPDEGLWEGQQHPLVDRNSD